jgi:hypothetical protein
MLVLKKFWISGWAWWLVPIISSTLAVEIWRVTVQNYLRKKVIKTPFQQISQAWWHMPVIPVYMEAKVAGKNECSYLKHS